MSAKKKSEVVVVTGAAAGLGRAVAEEFARHGAHVGLLARSAENLEQAKARMEALGGKAISVPTDVADPDQVEAAARAVEEAFGPIDVWVNVAMVGVLSPVAQMTPDEYKRVTEVNYLGYVYGTLSALHRMLPRDQGSIVQVGSSLAYRGIPLQSAYCGSKHAIQGFMDSLHTELLHDRSHVHATMVQMPAMNTPQFQWCRARMARHPQPVPPIYQPELCAKAVYWAAHHHRREVYVGLPSTLVIVGNKLAPSLADRYLARTGYNSQQTQELISPDRPDNLYEPVSGDWGARGPFSDRAHTRSLQIWETTHRGTLALAGAAVAAAAGVAALLAKK